MPSYLQYRPMFKNKYRTATAEVCTFAIKDINETLVIWRDDESPNVKEYVAKLWAELDVVRERLQEIEKEEPKKLLSQSVCFDSGSYIGYSNAQIELIRVGWMHALNCVYRLEKGTNDPMPVEEEG